MSGFLETVSELSSLFGVTLRSKIWRLPICTSKVRTSTSEEGEIAYLVPSSQPRPRNIHIEEHFLICDWSIWNHISRKRDVHIAPQVPSYYSFTASVRGVEYVWTRRIESQLRWGDKLMNIRWKTQDLLTWVTADRSPPPMNARGASLWETLYIAKFDNVGLSVPAAKNVSESALYDGENAMEDIIPCKICQWCSPTNETWRHAPFKPSLLFRDGVVAIRDPSPGWEISKTSIASSCPQYILQWYLNQMNLYDYR